MRSLGLVVEGHGEVAAVPVLVRRIFAESDLPSAMLPRLMPPHRVPRSRALAGELTRALDLQANRAGSDGAVLVLLDSDDDDPDALIGRVRDMAGPMKSALLVAVAVREYEAWFLAGIRSLRRHKSVRGDATFAGDPEQPRDAKDRLAHLMHETYKETIHQPAFSQIVDLDQVRRHSPSFDALCTRLLAWAAGD